MSWTTLIKHCQVGINVFSLSPNKMCTAEANHLGAQPPCKDRSKHISHRLGSWSTSRHQLLQMRCLHLIFKSHQSTLENTRLWTMEKNKSLKSEDTILFSPTQLCFRWQKMICGIMWSRLFCLWLDMGSKLLQTEIRNSQRLLDFTIGLNEHFLFGTFYLNDFVIAPAHEKYPFATGLLNFPTCCFASHFVSCCC